MDPESGIKHAQEPDKTMKSYRCVDEGASGLACLGMQMVPAAQSKELSKPTIDSDFVPD